VSLAKAFVYLWAFGLAIEELPDFRPQYELTAAGRVVLA